MYRNDLIFFPKLAPPSWWQLQCSSCLDLKSWIYFSFFNTLNTISQQSPFGSTFKIYSQSYNLSPLILLPAGQSPRHLLPATLWPSSLWLFHLLPFCYPHASWAPATLASLLSPEYKGPLLPEGTCSSTSSLGQESSPPQIIATLLAQFPPICSNVTSSMRTSLTTLFKVVNRPYPCFLDPFTLRYLIYFSQLLT